MKKTLIFKTTKILIMILIIYFVMFNCCGCVNKIEYEIKDMMVYSNYSSTLYLKYLKLTIPGLESKTQSYDAEVLFEYEETYLKQNRHNIGARWAASPYSNVEKTTQLKHNENVLEIVIDIYFEDINKKVYKKQNQFARFEILKTKNEVKFYSIKSNEYEYRSLTSFYVNDILITLSFDLENVNYFF